MPGVVRDRRLDRIGVAHDHDGLVRVRRRRPPSSAATMRACISRDRLAAREPRARRRDLHDLPLVGLREVGDLAAGPVAVVGFDHARRAAAPSRPWCAAMCSRGLRRALDRARVDRGDRQHREALAGGLGLPDALLGEVDAGHAARQQRTGVRGDGVAHEHEPRRRLRAASSPFGVVGLRRRSRLPIVPVASAAIRTYRRPRERVADTIAAPMTDVGLHRGGPPETVLDPEPADALRRARAPRSREPIEGRRDAVADVVRALAALPRRVGPARRSSAATTSRRTRTSGSATTAASTGCARPAGAASGYVRWEHETNRGLPARARRPARGAPRRSARPTRRRGAPSSSSSSTRTGTVADRS